MKKKQLVDSILKNSSFQSPCSMGEAFAPINIALVKYWGKRNLELNLPVTPSLSIAIPSKGAHVAIAVHKKQDDEVFISGELLTNEERISGFLALFRGPNNNYYSVAIEVNIPVAAGLASSAAIFAALIKALDDLYGWGLAKNDLSTLARLGSGSACRSLWNGFVKWQGRYAEPIATIWPELRVGLYIISKAKKAISSREAMQRTVATSKLYKRWPDIVSLDLDSIEQAIDNKDFGLFGKTAESNAKMMHATMIDSVPPIIYSTRETLAVRYQILKLRERGVNVYFTQDAGPNLKLLFLAKDTERVRQAFPELEVLAPFADPKEEQVVLVDKDDKAIGVAEKLAAHKNGVLHRAFSVVVLRNVNGKVEILLQQRQFDKYHCGGLWSNSCCSHPRPDEDIVTAAKRRLQEEMGFSANLKVVGKFQYRAEFVNGLTEHELDYVLVGEMDGQEILVNKSEVADYKWMELDALLEDLNQHPEKYTPWFKNVLELQNWCK